MPTLSSVRPVLMIPLRRCGSHAIRLRLALNPEFYSPYPLHIVDFMPLLPLYGSLSNDEAYFQLILDVTGLLSHSIVKWPAELPDPIRVFEELRDQPRSVHAITWELLLGCARKTGAKVAMDKSLDSVHYWRELKELFPDLRFINLVRDPRAQVSSMNKAIIHEFDTLLNAQILASAHRAAGELSAAHPGCVLNVRFEDFIESEEATLKLLCEFLEIKFLPEMLDISRSEEAKRISKQSALWVSNSHAPIKGNVDKYLKSLSPEEILQVETMASEMMDRFGYQKITAANGVFSAEQLAAARRISDERRKAAWESMRI